MSGPTTALFLSSDPLSILLSAALIRAQASIVNAHLLAERLRDENTERLEAHIAEINDESKSFQQQLKQAVQQAEEEFSGLLALAEQIGCAGQILAVRPASPADSSDEVLTAYVEALQAINAQCKPVLSAEAARRADQLHEGTDTTLSKTAAEQIPRRIADRLLRRIADLGEVPEPLKLLAQDLSLALPGPHADMLATELRLQVQKLLDAELQRQVQEAQALIIEQSLKDLGYQVEEIRETLFVEGGVVHFRRSDWGAYMVRLRIDTKQGTANFNVIRAVAEGENERSVADHIAEDRWCSEFPALLKALEARGLSLQVTRRLEAGELPVQLVLASKLPQFHEEEQRSQQQQLRQRPLQ
ncbi:hypothetical protein [Undibacterium luofuense]|uniref:Uncharacterized protein n=1 Tax=Undibacterium luofuense TaxID=2828733 RepID=A0A941DMX8_9BURK|nr:hypothetical protein [Undibacterium luofuense]MBR7783838.1 hypothetical protein [Undibacterium luofuense]